MASSQPSVRSMSSAHIHVAGEVCPWCDQPIPEDQSEKIHARIKEREEKQKVEQEVRLRQEFASSQANAQKQFEIEKTAAATKAREDSAKENAKIIEQMNKEAARKETAARTEASRAAKAEAAQRIEAADKAAMEAKKAAANAAAEVKAEKENKEAEIAKRLAEARDAHEKDKTTAINTVRSKFFDKNLKLEEHVNKLQRQLEQKTANELGEGAEIDLLDLLKGEFEGDLIQHVGKGKAGADVIHDIIRNGKVCGRIVYDCKNRTAWRNDYVTKLRDDQIAAKADYAILSSNVFPSGVKQLHEQDGVIIACPARVLVLVQMLRRVIIQMHTLKLSNQERAEKTASLYDYIRSDTCTLLFERFDEHTDNLLELQEKEKKQHDANWQKQGNLVRSIQKTSGNLTSAIDRIIGMAD
jgi:hypothetical protein